MNKSNSINNLYIKVGNWIVFQCDKHIAKDLVVQRKRMDSAFLKIIAKPINGMNSAGVDIKDTVEVLNPVLKSAHNIMHKRQQRKNILITNKKKIISILHIDDVIKALIWM